MDDGSCKPCANEWDTVNSNNKCANQCSNNHQWNYETSSCQQCQNFWEHVTDGNKCKPICPKNKSFNRYDKNWPCIDIYEAFNKLAENDIIKNNLKNDRLGGSLSNTLVCGETRDITTPFSAR